jgi:hypothetical protein
MPNVRPALDAPKRFGRHQLSVCLQQQPGEEQGPFALASLVGDQVLADLDQCAMQSTALAVHRDGIVRGVASRPGLG